MTAEAARRGRLRWRAGAAAAVFLSVLMLVGPKASVPVAIVGMGLTFASLADPLRAGIPRNRLLLTLGLIGAVFAVIGSLLSGAPLASVGFLALVVWTSSMWLLVHPTWTWVLYLSTVWLIAALNFPSGSPRHALMVGVAYLLGVLLYMAGTWLVPGPELPPQHQPAPSRRVVTRFALVRTVAITLSALVGGPLSPTHPFWAAAATHFVIRPTWQQQPRAAFWRAVGTACGAMTGLILAPVWPDSPALLVAMWISGTAIFLMGHLHGGVMMYWVTLLVLSILFLSGDDITVLGPARILTDIVGLTIGLVADGLLRSWLKKDAPTADG